MSLRATAFFALAGFSALAAGTDAIVLAPGKTVAVIDAGDPLIRVMVTAPADQALDLTPLLYSVGPRDSVYSIVTRMQVNEAAGLVENADGSLSLGAAPAVTAAPAATISGGTLVVLERGRYAHYKDEAALPPATQTAEALIGKKDEVPALGRIGRPAAAPAPAALVPNVLPTAAIAVPGSATLSIVNGTTGAITTLSTFSVGSSGSVSFNQPSASSTSLNAVTGGQTQIFGRITTTGSTTPGGAITVR
jgi:hypothetical protein